MNGRPALVPPATAAVSLVVDGTRHDVEVELGASLLVALRDGAGLMTVKDACEQGRCGSCSVLLDGVLVPSCAVLAADAADVAVTTVAGAAADVQECFLAAGAVQCGFCTPGFVVAVTDLLERQPDATEAEARAALAGNVCRCTGYGRILAAVADVQVRRRG